MGLRERIGVDVSRRLKLEDAIEWEKHVGARALEAYAVLDCARVALVRRAPGDDELVRAHAARAAQLAAEDAAKKAMEHGLQTVSVEVRGPGSGRESALRALQSAGLTVSMIRDVTPIPHNGCRPRKRRRV